MSIASVQPSPFSPLLHRIQGGALLDACMSTLRKIAIVFAAVIGIAAAFAFGSSLAGVVVGGAILVVALSLLQPCPPLPAYPHSTGHVHKSTPVYAPHTSTRGAFPSRKEKHVPVGRGHVPPRYTQVLVPQKKEKHVHVGNGHKHAFKSPHGGHVPVGGGHR